MTEAIGLIRLVGGGVAFVVDPGHPDGPRLLHFGPDDGDAPVVPPDPPLPAWSPGRPAGPGLFPQHGSGFFGHPALLGAPLGGSAETRLRVTEGRQDERSARIAMVGGGLAVLLDYALDAASGILTATTTLRNDGDVAYSLQHLASLVLPLPGWATHASWFEGGVFKEGHRRSAAIGHARIEHATRDGRSGHDWAHALFVHGERIDERNGEAIALLLGSNGNVAASVEGLGPLGAQAIVAEWLAPGEAILRPGEVYVAPPAHVAVSQQGWGGLSARLHRFVRGRIGAPSRPVQFNSWEAVYLDCGEAEAMQLADAAAALGIERFVLDDGWFAGRARDDAGLGDWTPDVSRYPRGLGPLIAHVRDLGMEFGLWVEPEMVNPDSALYRAHPDWVLALPDGERPLWRNQLVLDLTREDVAGHIREQLRGLLRAHPIGYIKWDCNRGLFPAVGKASRQARAVVELIAGLKRDFPHVSFESCASGGGRTDLAMIGPCDRVWISDNTDPIERVRIQRAASLFLPPEAIGTHVGGAPNPTTERSTPMAFRCLVALFGHMGIEFDPRRLGSEDRATLMQAIALYKAERALITAGDYHRIDGGTAGVAIDLIMAGDGMRGLLRVIQVEDVRPGARPPVRLPPAIGDGHYLVEEMQLDGTAPRELGRLPWSQLGAAGLDLLPPFGTMARLFRLSRA